MYIPTFSLSAILSMLALSSLYGNLPNNDSFINNSYSKDHYGVPPPQYSSDESAMIFFISGSYIYWQPYQQGMLLLNTSPKNPNVTAATSWIRPYMMPQSGFKLGAGINTFHDGWKVETEYTWFYNNPDMRSTALDLTFMNYYTPWPTTTDRVRTLSSRFKNLFQRITLTLDRTFYAGNYLALCPWGGLLGGWERQDFNIKMTYDIVNPDAKANIKHVDQTMNWWGIGPYAGLDSSYYFLDEWALFFSTGGALNLALHQTSKLETDEVSPIAGVWTRTKTKIPDIEPMLETALGLRFDSFGLDWGLRLQIGWELQVYFDHNSFIQSGSNVPVLNYSNYGNYAMQGLTAKIRANF